MTGLTEQGRSTVHDIAADAGVSDEAVMAMLHALQKGHGKSAQFDHPELGGMGQWMRGGMTQVGDMFNHDLKAKVDRIGNALAKALEQRSLFTEANEPQEFTPHEGGGSDAWWPKELGSPSATGGQNDSQYAMFPQKQRLAVKSGGKVRIYDSLDHRIGGFSQSQGSGAQELRFSSQHGTIAVSDLREVG